MSESTLVKMPHCWKSHVAAHLQFSVSYLQVLEGYGQTECGAICSLQMPGDGTIGKRAEIHHNKIQFNCLSYDVASRSDRIPCIKIDKPLMVYRFW